MPFRHSGNWVFPFVFMEAREKKMAQSRTLRKRQLQAPHAITRYAPLFRYAVVMARYADLYRSLLADIP